MIMNSKNSPTFKSAVNCRTEPTCNDGGHSDHCAASTHHQQQYTTMNVANNELVNSRQKSSLNTIESNQCHSVSDTVERFRTECMKRPKSNSTTTMANGQPQPSSMILPNQVFLSQQQCLYPFTSSSKHQEVLISTNRRFNNHLVTSLFSAKRNSNCSVDNYCHQSIYLKRYNFVFIALLLFNVVHFALFPLVESQHNGHEHHLLGGYDVRSIYTRRGANTTIVCEPASRTTKLYNLQWFKDDRKIVEIENKRIIVWQVGHHVSFIPETGALLLRDVSFTDSGDYLCIVNNKRDNGAARLFVQDVPDPPGQPFIMGFTSRSMNISWAPSFNTHHSPVLNYIIHTRIGENGDWDQGIATLDNRTEITLDKLQPFTVYSFRVIAVNSIGASQPGKESYYTVTQREIPDGKPIGLRVVNSTSSTLRLEWHPPSKASIHGEFMGYRLRYMKNVNSASLLLEREDTITDPEAKNYTIRNLEPYTEYLVTLRVFNPKGDGPTVTLAATTDEGVSSPPRNVSIQRVIDSQARVLWSEPILPNGRILGYHIYVHNVAANLTDSKKFHTSNLAQHTWEYDIKNLKPYTQYKVWIKAFTARTEGEASRTLEFLTDVSGPSAPLIVNLTCEGDTALLVQWTRPDLFYHTIDYYFVYYRSEHESDSDYEEIPINVPGIETRLEHDVRITNLTKGTLYEVKVQGATRSMKESSRLYRGEFSEPRKVILQSFSASSTSDLSLSASLFAGILCAAFAVCLALATFVLWRKYFQAAYYYLDDPAVNGNGSNPRASPNLSDIYIDETEYPPVPVGQWARHVQELHSDGDHGFSREYESLQRSTDMHSERITSEHSHLTENKSKNRYVNIVAYDHTRVMLKPLPGQKRSGHDYINANYIDGYLKPHAYIGTQGPLPSTFDDYWRMIWEQRVCIIVMITNLTERGRHYLQPRAELLDDGRKCDMYWPKENQETYGIVQVRLLQEVIMATYTLRTFQVKNLKIKKKYGNERTVYQYHYTNWPDHGVPEHPLPVLAFIRKSSAANPPNGGPIIVHCSAGVGRTGTYIVLDAMQRQIKHRGNVNVYGFLKHIRQQRNFLVQTEEQYIFIHDALLEAIDAGDTEVPSTNLLRYLQTLQIGGGPKMAPDGTIEKHSHWPLLERQFKMVTQFKAKDFNVVSALKPCNKSKNRTLNFIPLEAHRVHILPRTPGAEGSDYINATFLPGFSKLREFIITQHPIWDTIPDFWQMVWDHNVQTIVMLSSVIDEKEYPQFWPDREDESDYGSFKVKLINESRMMLNEGGFFITKRDLMLQSTQDDYELCCRVVHCADWPERQPLAQVFDLIRVVQEWCTSDTVAASAVVGGPVVVVDRFGSTEAATFSILTTLYKQLNFEDCVDVYMYAKLYHLRRPGIWRSQDDYLFLYRALEALISSSSTNAGSMIANTITNSTSGNGAIGYQQSSTPPSGVGTSGANTLTSTSSATHLMGSNTPPPTEGAIHYTLPRSGGGGMVDKNSESRINSSLNSSNSANVAYQAKMTSVALDGSSELMTAKVPPPYQYSNQAMAHQQQQQQQHLHYMANAAAAAAAAPHHHHHHSHSPNDLGMMGVGSASVATGSTVTAGGGSTTGSNRTPSPYGAMCDSPQQLLAVQTTTGAAGYSSYHISMIPASAAAATSIGGADSGIVHT